MFETKSGSVGIRDGKGAFYMVRVVILAGEDDRTFQLRLVKHHISQKESKVLFDPNRASITYTAHNDEVR